MKKKETLKERSGDGYAAECASRDALPREKSTETVRIFRRYARLCVGCERLNPIQMYARIEVLCASRKSRLNMLAVYELIRRLELYGEDETLGAFSAVYLADGSHRVSGADISYRVRLYAAEHFCDERTVYRRLERARGLYKSIREREGLLWDGVK